MEIESPWEDLQTVVRSAEAAQAADNRDLAHAFYVRGTELDPDRSELWRARAATTTDLNETVISLGYAHALAPDDSELSAEWQAQLGTRLSTATLTDAPALIELGRGLAEVGLREPALQMMRRATELDDTETEGLLWRAALSDDPKESLSALNQVLALHPDHPQARAGLQAALVRAQTPATPSDTCTAEALVAEGETHLQQGDKARAHELFIRATERDPHNEAAWLWRAGATSDIDEALTCLEQALAINPGNRPAREARGWLRVRKLREGVRAQATAVAPGAPTRVTPSLQQAQSLRRFWEQNRLTFLFFFLLLLIILSAYLMLRYLLV
jgi:tetratricopeptide (TPR) repeat protein